MYPYAYTILKSSQPAPSTAVATGYFKPAKSMYIMV